MPRRCSSACLAETSCAVDVGDEKLVYQVTPVGSDTSTLHLQTYQVRPSVGMQLLSSEELKLQMKSDANSGSKYIADNERGSIALWLSEARSGEAVSAKLAHKLPSGAYVGNQAQIEGSCKI